MQEEQNCFQFDFACAYFYFSAILTLMLCIFSFIQLVRSDFDSNMSSPYFGILSSLLTFWAIPPKMPKAPTASIRQNHTHTV